MIATTLLTDLHRSGIRLEARGDRLHVEAKPGTITDALRRLLTEHKAELLAALAKADEHAGAPAPACCRCWCACRRGGRTRRWRLGGLRRRNRLLPAGLAAALGDVLNLRQAGSRRVT